ncbi:MAG: amidohydrolase [Solirubrobacteraceae bacterium]|nr:amidohydrolase [Solirubrobacteraceae bacterium]
MLHRSPAPTTSRSTRRGYLGSLSLTAADAARGVLHRSSGGPHLQVDAHAHALPPRYRDALRAAGVKAPGGLPFPAWSESAALGFMRRYGIRAQVVSISDPGVEFLPVQASIELARELNDDLADLVRRRPDRFAALAVLPLRDVPASVQEVGRALDDLRLDGVGLLSNYDGYYLGDPRFRPLLQELDRRGAYVFVHPTSPLPADKPRRGLPDPIVEFPFETTRTVESLLRAGALQAYPRIRWHLAHAGGLVPALTDRLARDLPYDPSPALAALRYDTALSASPWALAGVRAVAPPEHLLLATDWPFTTLLFLFAGTAQPQLRRSVPAEELPGVLAGNILRELPRLAQAIGAARG